MLSRLIHGARLTLLIGLAVVALSIVVGVLLGLCLLYTSDAADDLLCVDLGGRRIIKKKKNHTTNCQSDYIVQL